MNASVGIRTVCVYSKRSVVSANARRTSGSENAGPFAFNPTRSSVVSGLASNPSYPPVAAPNMPIDEPTAASHSPASALAPGPRSAPKRTTIASSALGRSPTQFGFRSRMRTSASSFSATKYGPADESGVAPTPPWRIGVSVGTGQKNGNAPQDLISLGDPDRGRPNHGTEEPDVPA